MIEAVTFDFWNTLYVEDPDALRRRRDRRVAIAQSFFAAAGKKLKSQDVRLALTDVIETINTRRVDEHRCPDHAETGQMIAAKVGLSLSYDDAKVLAEAVSSAGRDLPPVPVDGAGVLLSELQSKVKLAVISDTGLTLGIHLQGVMASHGLAEFFDHYTWSDETMTTKPASRQFLFTLHMLDVTPDRAVHVGDLEPADIAGARDVGMKCIRIAPPQSDTAADARVDCLVDVADVLKRWGVG